MKNFRAVDMKRGGGTEAPPPAPAAEPESAQEDPQSAPEAEAEAEADTDTDAGEVPTGTTAEILQWVGSDTGRAGLAFKAENANPTPRAGLIGELTKILSA